MTIMTTTKKLFLIITLAALVAVVACGKKSQNKPTINTAPDASNISGFQWVQRTNNTLPRYLKSNYHWLRRAAGSTDKNLYMQMNVFYVPKTKGQNVEQYVADYDEYVTCKDGQSSTSVAKKNKSFHIVFSGTVTRKNNAVTLDGIGPIAKVAGKKTASYATVQILNLIHDTNYGTLNANYKMYYGNWTDDLDEYKAMSADGDEPTVVKTLTTANTCATAAGTMGDEMPVPELEGKWKQGPSTPTKGHGQTTIAAPQSPDTTNEPNLNP